jgi:hypothetical protein
MSYRNAVVARQVRSEKSVISNGLKSHAGKDWPSTLLPDLSRIHGGNKMDEADGGRYLDARLGGHTMVIEMTRLSMRLQMPLSSAKKLNAVTTMRNSFCRGVEISAPELNIHVSRLKLQRKNKKAG